MSLQITHIDPFDDAAVDAWWNAYAAAERADRGTHAPVWTHEESRRVLQHEAPQARAVYTYNAESNAHMLSVNTLLGFRPSERLGELQKRLG